MFRDHSLSMTVIGPCRIRVPWNFLKRFRIPGFRYNGIQDRWGQDRFQGIPDFYKSIWKFLWHLSEIHNKWSCCKNHGNIIGTWYDYMFWNFSYASNMLPCTSVAIICIIILTYIIMLLLQWFVSSTWLLYFYDEQFWVKLLILVISWKILNWRNLVSIFNSLQEIRYS